MPRPTKAAKAAQSEEIKAAKTPVAEAMATRAGILGALADHDAQSAKLIETLIEKSGVRGPFQFGGDVVVFHKSKAGTYDVHPFEVKTPI